MKIAHYVINENHPQFAELEEQVIIGLAQVSEVCRSHDLSVEQTHVELFDFLQAIADAHPDVMWPSFDKRDLN